MNIKMYTEDITQGCRLMKDAEFKKPPLCHVIIQY